MAKTTETNPAQTYEAYMRKQLDDVKPPTNLASGEWIFRCAGATSKPNDDYDPEDANGYLFGINFALVPVEPYANVDLDLVADGSWRGKRHFKSVYVRGDAEVDEAKKIIAGFGVNTEGRDLADGLELVKNRTAIVSVGLRTFKNKRTGETEQANTYANFRPVA